MRDKFIKKGIIAVALLLLVMSTAHAADRYWIGAGGAVNTWNNTANWSATSGGAGGASVPTTSDVAIFDANGLGNCNIDMAVDVAGINVTSGYTGTISQGANTITVGTSNSVFAGGTFSGGSVDMTCNGTFTLSGTAFTSTSARLLIRNLSFTGGTFTHNNGRVTFGSNSTGSSSIDGSITLYEAEFNGVSYNMTFNISATTVLTVNNTLEYTGSTAITINTGTIHAKGDITLSNTSAGGGGNATIIINGTGSQTLSGPFVLPNSQSRLPNIEINKTAGTLYLKDFLAVVGNWKYVQGTIDVSTYSSTIHFINTKTIEGTHSLNNVWLSGSTLSTYTIASGSVVTVTGSLTYTSTNRIIVDTGTLEVHGDINLNNTYSISGGGTATIRIAGQGDQTFKGSSTAYANRVGSVEINKPSGTLYLENTITVNGNWTYTSGTVDPGTSTVIFLTGKTISGSHTLYSVMFTGGTYIINNTLTVTGVFNTTYTGDIAIYTGTIEVKGDIALANTGNGSGGTATINISGTGDQTFTGSSTAYKSRLGNITIDKPSGTLYLQNLITVVGNWNYVQGTVDAGTSTLIFQGAKTISGTHSLYNVTFPGAIYTISGTLTVNGTLKTELSGDTQINTGTIVANGDIILNNTGNGSGGTGTIKISGDADQSFTGNGIAVAGRLCNVLINKSSGTLTLSSIISCGGNWTYEQGKVDASTNSATVVLLATKNLDAEGSAGVMSFHHLNIFNGTRTITGELNVAGGFTISSTATLTNTTHSFNVGGNWSNSGTYNRGTATVTFNGTGDIQTIRKSSGAETFYGLAVNKEAGYVSLDGAVTVTHSLSLSKGNIASTSTNLLTLNDNATVTGGSDASYVSGPMKKVGNDAFTFPLGGTSGGANYYHPLSITAPGVTTDAFTAEYKPIAQTYGSSITDALESVSSCEHWTLSRDAGSSDVQVTLGWDASSCSMNDIGHLTVAEWNGTQWSDLGEPAISITWPKGSFTTGTLVGFSVNLSPKPLVIAQYKKTLPYATLKRKLDGSFYVTTKGTIRYKFDDEYNDSGNATLTYKIFDSNNTDIKPLLVPTANNTPVPKHGDNRFTIDMFGQSTVIPPGYYILEVTNEKLEKWYLRIKKQ